MRLLAIALAAATLTGIPALALGTGADDRRPNIDDDGIQVTAVGRVENIRQDRVFTLSTRRMTFTVVMRPGSSVLGDRLFQGDRRLREGDRVRVTGELSDAGRIIAEDVDILPGGGGIRPGRGLEGTLRNLDLTGRRFVLAAPNGNLRMVFDEDTDWIRNRQEASPSSFRNGESIRVMARQRGGDYLVRRVVMGGDPGWENRAVGEIVELNRANQTAEVDFDGRVEVVDMRNATIRRYARTIRFADLRTGMDVRVQGTREGRRINATQVDVARVFGEDAGELRTIEGRIAAINVENRVIRVDQAVGGEVRVEVDESTRVVRGAQQVRPAALREGQRVRVRGRLVRGAAGRDALEALRIEIL